MKKNNHLARRLTLIMTSMLLCMSIALSLILFFRQRHRIVAAHEDELLTRAQRIAQILTSNDLIMLLPEETGSEATDRQTDEVTDRQTENETMKTPAGNRGSIDKQDVPKAGMKGRQQGQRGGLRQLIRFFDEIADQNIWVVDREGRSLLVGEGQPDISWDMLGSVDQLWIDRVFAGNQTTTHQFGSLLGNASLTAGVPLYDKQQAILGAVLIHENLDLLEAQLSDLRINLAVALAIAMLGGVLLAFLISRRISRPLLEMEQMTQLIAAGDYSRRLEHKGRDEVASLAGHIDQMSDQLAENMRQTAIRDQAKRDFIARISHELKTPVTVLQGNLEAIADGVLQPDAELLAQMHAEVKMLSRLIQDLFDLSKLQNPDFVIECQPVSWGQVVREAIRSQTFSAERAGKTIDFREDTPPDQILLVSGDEQRLRQLLVILIQNAIKFSDPHTAIRIRLSAADGYTECSVTSTGQPIEDADREKIFSQFYQADPRGNSGIRSGSGLGLAIARAICEAHGAAIKVQTDARDSTFTVTLRLAESEEGTGSGGQEAD